jgi:hypothetical protein
MSHSGQLVLTFVIGGAIGLLVGWTTARARFAPVGDDSVPPQGRTVGRALVTFVKNAALVAVAAVVILALAVNLVNSRR